MEKSEFLKNIEEKISHIMSSSGAHAPGDTTQKLVTSLSEHFDELAGKLEKAEARIADLETAANETVEKLQSPEPDTAPQPEPEESGDDE